MIRRSYEQNDICELICFGNEEKLKPRSKSRKRGECE